MLRVWRRGYPQISRKTRLVTFTVERYNPDHESISIGGHDRGVGDCTWCDVSCFCFSAINRGTTAAHPRRIFVVAIGFGSDGLATVVWYIQSRMVNGGE